MYYYYLLTRLSDVANVTDSALLLRRHGLIFGVLVEESIANAGKETLSVKTCGYYDWFNKKVHPLRLPMKWPEEWCAVADTLSDGFREQPNNPFCKGQEPWVFIGSCRDASSELPWEFVTLFFIYDGWCHHKKKSLLGHCSVSVEFVRLEREST